ncbi:MAG: phosphotransferase [Oscillospiraceae bacterium]|nr:phosphotransferase [Oscillospiraceae bacterium]
METIDFAKITDITRQDMIRQALSFYDITVMSIEALNDDSDAFKLTDSAGTRYFLKVYGKSNDGDIVPGERVYHTYDQIQLESEILHLLSGSASKTAAPVKNIHGGFVTALAPETDGEPVFATVTSFIDGLTEKHTEAPTPETAHIAGVSAALLHLESKKLLLPIAAKRPHKRQEYIQKMQDRIAQGIKIGSITAAQYEMISQCCDAIIDCMNQLDKDPENNVGLVHTDIINGNIVFAQNRGTLIDFSRSVYSYYLFDLAEMCLHGNFGGSSPELQRAILCGYHSVKPLAEYDLFAMQALFAMFILTIMAMCIESKGNAWMESVLKWFADEVHPGLIASTGYMDPAIFKGIL